jgi:hypothetical protein
MNSPHLYYEEHRMYENLHQNVRFMPERYYDVWNFWDDNSWPMARRWEPGLQALQKIIAEAGHNAKPARGLGAGWSLSRAVETNGYLLNTKPLNIIEVGLQPGHCAPEFLHPRKKGIPSGKPEHLVFAQCGATIAELSRELENRGLSLSTSGASNGQTICGAMSTGTHGSAYTLQGGGSVPDYVVGVHLIAPDFDFWIQRASEPVVTQSFCDILQTTLKADDDLFDAVRVAFGSFGMIHAVLLRAEPIYLLERHVCPMPFERVAPVVGNLNNLPQLKLTDITGNIPPEPPYHFELLFNPYALLFDGGKLTDNRDGPTCGPSTLVRYMFKRKPDFHALIGREPESSTNSNGFYGFLGGFSVLAANIGATGVPASFIMNAQQSDNGVGNAGTILTHGGTFDATALAGHGQSCEIGLAVADALPALETIVRSMHSHPLASAPAFRYIQPGTACLGWAKFAPYTCAIELPAPDTHGTIDGYEHIWAALDKAGINFTFHWGQTMRDEPTAAGGLARLRRIFGGPAVDTWLRARKQVLKSAAAREMFSNPMLKRLGLDG